MTQTPLDNLDLYTKDEGARASEHRVLFALLAQPNLLQETTRAIAIASGVPGPQLARDMRDHLTDRGFALKRRRGRHLWTPSGYQRAFDWWIADFASILSPYLLIGRFRASEQDLSLQESTLTQRLGALGGWRWGGGVAAQRLAPYSRGERTLIYLSQPITLTTISDALGLCADPLGPITFASSPGPLAFHGPAPDCVHPLLAYADLLQDNHDRAAEAAQTIRALYLT
jgi:hypothetical protein